MTWVNSIAPGGNYRTLNGGSSERRLDRTKGGKGSVPSPSPHPHVLLEKHYYGTPVFIPPPSVASVSTVMRNMKLESPERARVICCNIFREGEIRPMQQLKALAPPMAGKKRMEGRSGHCRRDELEREDRRTGAHGECLTVGRKGPRHLLLISS